jgi:hypothetical protein
MKSNRDEGDAAIETEVSTPLPLDRSLRLQTTDGE